MQAVVVTFDRLATSALGCYGNEWIETPNLDRLAANGVVFDSHFAEHIGRSAGMAWSTGQLPANDSAEPYSIDELWSLALEPAGVELHLVNEFEILPWSMLLKKTSRTLIAIRHAENPKPTDIPFAGAVRSAQELLAVPPGGQSRVIWLHSAGVPEPWKPPEGFATLYFEDFEERGHVMSSLPSEAWGTHPAIYAGYVSLLDYWLGELISTVQAAATKEPTLLIVTAARGCHWTKCGWQTFRPQSSPAAADDPNFEGDGVETSVVEKVTMTPTSRAFAFESPALADVVTRSPLLIRMFDPSEETSELAGVRTNRLVQTVDLPATLLDYFQVTRPSSLTHSRSWLEELREIEPPRKFICFTDGEGARGIRTTRWSCLVDESESSDANEPQTQLFAKPEDIWEVNDVSGQQRELIDELTSQLDQTLPRAEPRAIQGASET